MELIVCITLRDYCCCFLFEVCFRLLTFGLIYDTGDVVVVQLPWLFELEYLSMDLLRLVGVFCLNCL